VVGIVVLKPSLLDRVGDQKNHICFSPTNLGSDGAKCQMLSKFQTSVLLTLMLCASLRVSARQGVPFSADITFTANGETRTGRVYSDGQSIRIESEATVPGQKSVSFLRLESGLAQQDVNSQEKAYIEYPYGTASDAQFIRYLRDAKVKSEQLGKEFLDGQEYEKVRVTTTYKGQVYASVEWRSKALFGLVVKSQDVKAQWSAEYKNIKPGEQPASLFELPSGYNRIAFSRDWTPVVKQIAFAGALGLSKGISIARKAGLRVEEGSQLPNYRSASFIDPVTGSTVLHIDVNSD